MSAALPPTSWTWTGEHMAPLNPRWARQADATFVVGETYTFVPYEERSGNSHRHFFATVKDLWDSLPEAMAGEFPTPEHLRKRALIRTGYHDQRSIVCASKAEALRVAAFIQPLDTYAEISVSGCVVVHLTAKSQDYRSMGREIFGESKSAVLDWISDLIGVDPQHVGRAA
jgi:hypothetical protein